MCKHKRLVVLAFKKVEAINRTKWLDVAHALSVYKLFLDFYCPRYDNFA